MSHRGPRPALRRTVRASLLLMVLTTLSLQGLGGIPARADSTPAPEPGVCQGCQPPLKNLGGATLGTDGLTITPIYWAVPGAPAFPARYQKVINQYISDVAAASGANDNVYAITTEYYQQASDGSKQPIKYQITAGSPVTVSDAPGTSANPCSPNPSTAFAVCISQDQLQSELLNAVTSNNLGADAKHLYVLMLPSGVQTCEAGACSGILYCGIHQQFSTTTGATVIYADQPYPVSGCASGQSPNGDPAADAQVSVISHELIEAITDPGSPRTWNDNAGNEIGDECNFNFGPPAGSADPGNAQTTQYNQVINGHYYWTQTEFSDAAYAANGVGKGCVTTEPGGSSSSTPNATPAAFKLGTSTQDIPAEGTMDLSDTKLDADGKATSTATLEVDDNNGEPVGGDHIHFNVVPSDVTTAGVCGTVQPADVTTDDNGQAKTTYTSSKDNVACIVVGLDSESGASDWGTVYQGSAADDEPAISDANLPSSISPGSGTQTFTVTAQNPSKQDLHDVRFDVFLTGDGNGNSGVQANQVHISYAGAGGGSTKIALQGQTTKGGEIEGNATPDTSATLKAGQSETVTFQVSLDSGAPATSATGSPLHLEVDLDQFNPADGSTDNLDYIGPADVTVSGSSSSGPPVWIWIVIAGVVLLLLGGGVAMSRRKKGQPTAG